MWGLGFRGSGVGFGGWGLGVEGWVLGAGGWGLGVEVWVSGVTAAILLLGTQQQRSNSKQLALF